MEQFYSPMQYFCTTLIVMAAFMYVAGLYLAMQDKYEKKRREGKDEFR